MCRSNEERFRKHCGPFVIDADTLEVTRCFMRHGVRWAGCYGMLGADRENNALKFSRTAGFEGGGILVFPNRLDRPPQDRPFAPHARAACVWGKEFGGKFPYRGNLYDCRSLTLDIARVPAECIAEIAKDAARRWDTDVLFKVFPSGRIFLVKRKDPFARVVAWIPHTNTYLPNVPHTPQFDALRRDAALLADTQADRLFPFLSNKIKSDFSRFAVDLERYADNAQEPMAPKGMGRFYNRLIDGAPFDRAVFGGDDFFARYYAQKHDELKRAVERIGNGALLLDVHSFNPQPLPCDLDKTSDRPDICLGFNADDTKPDRAVLHALKTHFEQNGLRVAFNTPFSGAMTCPTETKYTALMLEINKARYLTHNTPDADIYKLAHILREAVLLCTGEENNGTHAAARQRGCIQANEQQRNDVF